MKEIWRNFDRRRGHETYGFKIDIFGCLRMWAKFQARRIADRLKWDRKLKEIKQDEAEFYAMFDKEGEE